MIKIIVYASRRLKIYKKKNYLTHDLKSMNIVFALKIEHHYLYCVHMNVFTNQKVFNKLSIRKKMARIALEYDMSISITQI